MQVRIGLSHPHVAWYEFRQLQQHSLPSFPYYTPKEAWSRLANSHHVPRSQLD